MSRVLVSAVEPDTVDGLARTLRHEGHDVTVGAVSDGTILSTSACGPDLLVLDVGDAVVKGAALCRDVRAVSRVLPVLVISCSGDECDIVECLDAGADDYVARPFRLAELLARVRALLRRDAVPAPAGDLRIDAASRRAWAGGKELALTGKEFELLRVLAAHAGQVVSRRAIMEEVWGPQWYGSAKTLDMHVSALRRKLGDDVTQPRHVTTVRGMGFRLERD